MFRLSLTVKNVVNNKNRPLRQQETVLHIPEDILNLKDKYIVSSSDSPRKRNVSSMLAVIFVPAIT